MSMMYSISKNCTRARGVLLYMAIGCTMCMVSCFKNSTLTPEEYYEQCPYELKYGRPHLLEVPVTVSPHQLTYSVGDTITFTMRYSDSVYDISRDTKFKIEGFPFEPVTLAYLMQGDTAWLSAYYYNEVLIDSTQYNPRYNPQTNRPADMRGFTVYEDGYYHFEYKLVMNTPGRYITVITDQYESNLGTLSHRNDPANAVQFEGRCPQSNFAIATVIQGDAHFEDFIPELVYLDKEVHNDNWSRLDDVDKVHFGGGRGKFLEWIGIYCFEVIE